MIEELKNLFKHSFIYSIGNISNKVIAFALIPLYTYYLTPAQYGILSLIELAGYIVSMFLGFGISQSILRFYYEQNDEQEKSKIITSSILLSTAISLLGLTPLLFLSDRLSQIIFESNLYSNLINIMLFTLIFSLICEVLLTYLKVVEKSILYTATMLGRTVLSLSLNIVFIVFLKLGIIGILISSLITIGLNTVIVFLLIRKNVKLKLQIYKAKEMLKYGLPFIPGGVGMFILNFGDRFFLQRYSDLSEVGIYSLGYKFGMLLQLLLFEPFMSIWGKKRFEIAMRDDGKEIIARVFTYYCFVYLFFGLGVSLLTKDTLKIIAGYDYHTAHKIVPIIILSYFFLAAYFHIQIGILLNKVTKYIAYIISLGAISNIFLCWLLIPKFHSMGAAIATLCSFIIIFLLNFYIANKFYTIPIEYSRIIKMILLSFGIFVVATIFQTDSLLPSLGYNFALTISFPILLYYFNFYTNNEIELLKQLRLKIIRTRLLAIKKE